MCLLIVRRLREQHRRPRWRTCAGASERRVPVPPRRASVGATATFARRLPLREAPGRTEGSLRVESVEYGTCMPTSVVESSAMALARVET